MDPDRSETKKGMDRRRVTVPEAAVILGITPEAVRTRIKRGKLESVKEPPDRTGTVYVLLQADQTGPNVDLTLQGQDQTFDQTEVVESLREQIGYLQGVIATRDKELAVRAEEIHRRDTALEREQQLAAFFAERLRELEMPASSSEPRGPPEGTAGPGPTEKMDPPDPPGGADASKECPQADTSGGLTEPQLAKGEVSREDEEGLVRRARRNLPVLGDVGLIMLVLGVLGFVVYALLTRGSP